MHASGLLRPESRSDELALTLLAAVQGGLLLGQVQRSTRPLRVALDTVIDHIESQTRQPERRCGSPDDLPEAAVLRSGS